MNRDARWCAVAVLTILLAFWGFGARAVLAQDCPVVTGHCEDPEEPYQVAVSAGHAFVIDTSPALRVIDVSTPAAPVEVGTFDTWGWGTGVAIAGQYCYVATLMGVHVVDVSSPSEPAGVMELTDIRRGKLRVSGSFLLHAYEDGVWVLDITNRAAPTQVAFVTTERHAEDAVISGNHLYVANGQYGLRVFDMSVPAEPVEVGFIITPGWAVAVAVAGNVAYVADSYAGLRIIDVSNPAAPVEVGFTAMDGATDVALSTSGLALVADSDQNGGLRVIDVRSPSEPVQVGHGDGIPGATSVAVSGDMAYVGDLPTGLHLFDLSQCITAVPWPPEPRRVRGRLQPSGPR